MLQTVFFVMFHTFAVIKFAFAMLAFVSVYVKISTCYLKKGFTCIFIVYGQIATKKVM